LASLVATAVIGLDAQVRVPEIARLRRKNEVNGELLQVATTTHAPSQPKRGGVEGRQFGRIVHNLTSWRKPACAHSTHRRRSFRPDRGKWSEPWRARNLSEPAKNPSASSVASRKIITASAVPSGMPRVLRFYPTLGFEVLHGGEDSSFHQLSSRNELSQPHHPALPSGAGPGGGLVIFYVSDVDALYDRALAAGYKPATAPHDAKWGERFFHLIDPRTRLCSRFPSNSSSKRSAISRGAGRAYCAPMIR
jgi:hypothetical protein